MFSISLNVKRDITIQKGQKRVFDDLSSFETWKFWSPWVCQEPSCPVEISGQKGKVGHQQKWDGKMIGSGQMTITALEDSKRVDYLIEFLKPWKSTSKISFFIEPYDSSSHVIWTMESKIPFFLFFMKKQMEHYIGFDYSRGLNMLKEWIEQGSVPSFSDAKGVTKKEKINFIGKRRQCSLVEFEKFMENDFSDLDASEKRGLLAKPDEILSIYHTFDIIRGVCDYTACYAYKAVPSPLPYPKNFVAGSIPEHNAFQVDHTGAYRHIANAWTTALNSIRFLKLKRKSSVPMYEIYHNFSPTTEESMLKTQVMVPVV